LTGGADEVALTLGLILAPVAGVTRGAPGVGAGLPARVLDAPFSRGEGRGTAVFVAGATVASGDDRSLFWLEPQATVAAQKARATALLGFIGPPRSV
jgi:hypothetical protein